MVKNALRLIFGLCLYSVGIIMTVQAQIGYAPWDTFHYGISEHIGLSYGVTSIIVGGIAMLIAIILGEKIGIGTVLNMTLIGIFCDVILQNQWITTPDAYIGKVMLLVTGLLVIAFASYFYISSGFGAGPRDSLMVGLSKRLHLPVGVCRNMIELSVLATGWLLGGAVGVGTVLSALLMGVFIQLVFKLMRFDVKSVRHMTIMWKKQPVSDIETASK
ncbi:hypothetical protein KHM83_18530 [Fusibacter paucivorans]|uniref:Membrane protein YczE n=1 Tax=Fusibacter paucivorans TaxID=76009 RepID=A0ABS5PU30_9FIRM|nr:hypothetical protein [Fusibacter paucivorans]MBS7528669.1 hypothetical protein [Fusibacter paucivorans]